VRKLASLQKIRELNEIKNADRIESAKVLGWNVVVRKGDFKVGDLCIYVEIDSILPERKEFEFLREKKFRIKTRKIRGIISQGIAFPLSILNNFFDKISIQRDAMTNEINSILATKAGKQFELKIGDDLTELLGIKKYEPPIKIDLTEKIKGDFPSFIPKTDEPRVQTIPEILERYKGHKFYITEKVDGCLSYRTKIKTDKGDFEIGKIVNQKMNVNILTYNENLKKNEFKKILKYHKYPLNNRKILKIGIECHQGKGNGEKYIICTDNHKYFTENKKWIEAKNLKVGNNIYHLGDKIKTNNCLVKTPIITISEDIPSDEQKYLNFVYDLTIEDNHNYFAQQILTHNSSLTYYIKDKEFGVCTRNKEWLKSDTIQWKLAEKYNVEEKLLATGKNIAIQCEAIGLKIQGNKYKINDHIFLVFSVFDIDERKYYDFKDLKAFTEENGFKIVPIIEESFTLNHTIEELVELSIGNSLLNKNVYREGIIIRSITEINDFEIGRLSFKVLNPKFLLKYE